MHPSRSSGIWSAYGPLDSIPMDDAFSGRQSCSSSVVAHAWIVRDPRFRTWTVSGPFFGIVIRLFPLARFLLFCKKEISAKIPISSIRTYTSASLTQKTQKQHGLQHAARNRMHRAGVVPHARRSTPILGLGALVYRNFFRSPRDIRLYKSSACFLRYAKPGKKSLVMRDSCTPRRRSVSSKEWTSACGPEM